MIRVALVDDERLIRVGVGVVIDAQTDMTVVGEAADGGAAVDLVRATRPDVVLMDVQMSPVDGVEATRRILAAHPDGDGPKIILLTTFDFDERASEAVRYGAEGFLLKDSDPEFICAAIRAVHAGQPVLAPQRLDDMLSRQPVPPAFANLSDGERDVFDAVAEGLSNAEIAARLFVSESTVKARVSSILRTLELRDRVQLVVYSYRNELGRRDRRED